MGCEAARRELRDRGTLARISAQSGKGNDGAGRLDISRVPMATGLRSAVRRNPRSNRVGPRTPASMTSGYRSTTLSTTAISRRFSRSRPRSIKVKQLHQFARANNRYPGELEIIVGPYNKPAMPSDLKHFRAAGVQEFALTVGFEVPGRPSAIRAWMEKLASEWVEPASKLI
jgi:hypothetical protein